MKKSTLKKYINKKIYVYFGNFKSEFGILQFNEKSQYFYFEQLNCRLYFRAYQVRKVVEK